MRFLAVDPPSEAFAKPCQFCLSHKTNKDGYLYKSWRKNGRLTKGPFYRLLFQASQGWESWPEGLEADHKCHNRWCVEPSHIRALSRSDHKAVTNATRHAERHEEACVHWLATGCTGTALAELFGVTFSTGCRWIRDWRAEQAAT